MPPPIPTRLPWTTALVTGASSGIGEAVCRELAGRGVEHLVVVARRLALLERLAAELHERHGTSIEVMAADLADAADLARVEARLGATGEHPVDLLVNNAGFGTSGDFAELAIEGEDREVRVNALAPLRLMSAVLPGMVGRGRGAVMNVSSMAAYQPAPGNATYAATKVFLTSLSESVHEELRGTGVTVTSVNPGYTRTGFQATVGDSDYTSVPDRAWMTAEAVALEAVEATAAGKALCVPGLGYKLAAGVTTPLPRSAKRWLMGRASARTRTRPDRS